MLREHGAACEEFGNIRQMRGAVGMSDRSGKAVDEDVQHHFSSCGTMPEQNRGAHSIWRRFIGVQLRIFVQTEEAECPLAQIYVMRSCGCCCHRKFLIRHRARDGDNRFPTLGELDLGRAAYLARLLQIEEKVTVSVAGEPAVVTCIREHIAVVGKPCIFYIDSAPKTRAVLGIRNRNRL